MAELNSAQRRPLAMYDSKEKLTLLAVEDDIFS